MSVVVVLPWDGTVEGLGPEAASMPLWGGTLGEATRGAIQAAGLRAVDSLPPGEDALVVADGTALGPEALTSALAIGRARPSDVAFRLAGRIGRRVEEARLGVAPAGLWYLSGAAQGSVQDRIARCPPLDFDPAERTFDVGLPGAEPFAVSDRLFLPVRHWVHLLWANLFGLGPFLWGELLGRWPLLALLRLGVAVVRSLSLRPDVLAARLTRRAPGVKVHHAAVVEASVLAAGVRVGAGAVVRGCVLGPGTIVEDLALCEGVVAGSGVLVQRQALVKYSLLAADARVGGAVQLGVLGPAASVKRGSYLMDQGLDGPVRVRVGDALVPAPQGLAGVCLGAEVAVGSGVWVAPGRVVPAGTKVLGGNALAYPDPPDGAGGPLVVRDRRLEKP